MANLSKHIKSKIGLEALHSVILAELERGRANLEDLALRFKLAAGDRQKIKKLVKESGFSEEECRYVLANIKTDIRKCASLEVRYPERVACFGDKVLKTVYKLKKGDKRLDVLAVACPLANPRWGWFLAECKFEVKTSVGGPFSAEDNFEETVDRKFEHIQGKMRKDKEPYYRGRVLLVVSRDVQLCKKHLLSMRRGTIDKKMDFSLYMLCTVDDVVAAYKTSAKEFRKLKPGRTTVLESFG